ncbi:MAG: hypothetical protein NTU73_13810, partial [Ignavibacteriae bacterium]|nr:hypothetical protein [Ignavibacteriota bacterium]
MRTKIGVLSVFLVFLSLSCQKDSGVESAGNTPQKVNSIQKGNTTQTDNVPKKYTIYMKITQHIPGEEDYVCLIESRVSDIEPSNAFEWGNFHTRPSESVCTFDIECNFSWEGCPESNPGYPKICLFSVI